MKYSADHINLEEEHNVKYKTPMFFVNLSYRFALFLSFYMIVYTSFYLDDVGKVFIQNEHSYAASTHNNQDVAARYEKVYVKGKLSSY